MSISVVINGETFQIPVQGQTPPWGTDLTDLLVALSNSVNSLSGSTDIALTTFNLANNQSSVANITGASFDTAQVRSAFFTYSIYRATSLEEAAECGQLLLTYKSVAGTWELAQYHSGSSGIVFTITTGGQIQYTSTNMSGAGYTGVIKFKASTFAQ